MSTLRESSHVSRKYVSHGGAISGQGHSANSSNSLENNLVNSHLRCPPPPPLRSHTLEYGYSVPDALLEDLQTSVSRSATPSGRRPYSPQVESISPTRTSTTTREKYVSTGPSGVGSGIPGLEALDAELRNFNKSQDGKPVDSYGTTDRAFTTNTSPFSDDIHEASYEEIHRKRKNAEKITKTSAVNRELVYGDTYSSSRSKQASPLPGAQTRDVKIIREATKYGIEQVPVPSPTSTIPLNLAPGPNTKVTTTIKTYTYELPGAPEIYLPPGHSGTDQTVTYKLDKTLERSASPIRYTSTPEINQKSSILHKESKYYQEDLRGSPTYRKPSSPYSAGPSPTPTNLETTTTRKENFYIRDDRYENGYLPVDRTDYPGYQSHPHPPYTETTTTTMIDRIEEHFPDKPASPSRSYYTATPPITPQSANVYKYSKESYSNHHASDREVLLPKPFPTGTQLYPVNGKGPSNGQGPPAKLDDLMASFSESEREVLVDIKREEQMQRKNKTQENGVPKKGVDFISHTPPKVQSKNVAGPPVYYPPGSAEFTKKEEGAMMQASGEWARARGQYEYEASSKTKTKQSSGKAVVPVCLPLCCALPCVIM
ncbi:Protein of unknown function [Cotesia congregata]|uniref:Uncharacterized protein n=1 Tax=Cotesia congregata TaxID=51543 RepID=A0A8J2HQI2_COTCN|nr:Protein of unknown function [Cotesia congregata]